MSNGHLRAHASVCERGWDGAGRGGEVESPKIKEQRERKRESARERAREGGGEREGGRNGKRADRGGRVGGWLGVRGVGGEREGERREREFSSTKEKEEKQIALYKKNEGKPAHKKTRTSITRKKEQGKTQGKHTHNRTSR
jgi:hypothetical protein